MDRENPGPRDHRKTRRVWQYIRYKEIAFEFASWISVEFKLYLIREFQRLKDEERKTLGWDIRREGPQTGGVIPSVNRDRFVASGRSNTGTVVPCPPLGDPRSHSPHSVGDSPPGTPRILQLHAKVPYLCTRFFEIRNFRSIYANRTTICGEKSA